MRVRKRKNGDARRAACAGLILPFDKNNIAMYSSVREIFSEENGLKEFRLEIGCGKGAFITALAARHPDIGFLAVEKVGDVILPAAEKTQAAGLSNVRFLNCDAEHLEKLFPAHSFSRVYLNFSDPWPKARHAKRRLTYRDSLVRIAAMLAPDGYIEFKTDNRALFDFSLEEFPAAGFTLRNITYDLHASEWAQENIMTEYEINFSEKGFKINRLEAYLPE